MKDKHHLNKIYQEALKDYQAPLREGQWNRLQDAYLNARREKSRKYFYWFSLAAVLLISSGVVVYTISHKKTTPVKTTLAQTTNDTGLNSDKANTPGNTNEQLPVSNYASQEPANSQFSSPHKTHTNSAIHRINSVNYPEQKAFIIPQSEPFNDTRNIEGEAIPYIAEIHEKNPEQTTENPGENKSTGMHDSTFKTAKLDSTNKTKPVKNNPKHWYLTAALGTAAFGNHLLSISDPEKQHKDAGNVYEMNNRNLHTRAFSIGVEFAPQKGFRLGFTTGMQIRQISSQVNFNYNYSEIPFKDVDGSIIGYIKDTAGGTAYHYQSRNAVTYAYVPLYFRYPLLQFPKSELLAGAGLNALCVLKAAGSYFTINQPEITKLTTGDYKRLSAGYSAGLAYNRRIGKENFVGIEAQYQSMAQSFSKNNSGAVKSNISGIFTQISFRYQIK